MGTDSADTIRGKSAAKSAQGRNRQSLADALFTATQQRVLGLLYGQTGRSFFVTELIDLAGVGRGAIQRELLRLERGGLVTIERQGTQKHYKANPDTPIYDELCSIIKKTIGLQEQIRTALQPLEDQTTLALIYGSVAKQSDSASSDIDVLIVSDSLILEDIYSHLSDVETQLGRQVNPTLYTTKEFERRRTKGNTFLERVLNGRVIVLYGDIDGQ